MPKNAKSPGFLLNFISFLKPRKKTCHCLYVPYSISKSFAYFGETPTRAYRFNPHRSSVALKGTPGVLSTMNYQQLRSGCSCLRKCINRRHGYMGKACFISGMPWIKKKKRVSGDTRHADPHFVVLYRRPSWGWCSASFGGWIWRMSYCWKIYRMPFLVKRLMMAL